MDVWEKVKVYSLGGIDEWSHLYHTMGWTVEHTYGSHDGILPYVMLFGVRVFLVWFTAVSKCLNWIIVDNQRCIHTLYSLYDKKRIWRGLIEYFGWISGSETFCVFSMGRKETKKVTKSS